MANSTDRPLSKPDATQTGHSAAHESDLAAANLSRLRGLFTDAEAICIRVLRADPNNVHAHSLIGDIYRDQGRFEDACQWYQLALDLQPDSRPDQSKLEETRAERDRRRGKSDPMDRTQRVLGASPAVWIRWATGAAAVFLATVAVFLIAQRRATTSPLAGAGPHTSGGPAPANAGASPAIPNVLGSKSAPSGPGGLIAPPGQPAPAAPRQPTPEIMAVERTLEELVSQSVSGFSVLAFTIDPDGGHLTAVLHHQPAPGAGDSREAQEQIAQAAARAVMPVFGQVPNLASITVIVRQSIGKDRTIPCFRGELWRQAMYYAAGTPTSRLYSAAWFSAAEDPSADAGSAGSPAPSDAGAPPTVGGQPGQ